MIGAYVELIEDVYPFLKGTQFKVEHEDDGMYSLCDFFGGTVLVDGVNYSISCEWEECKYIDASEFKGLVFKELLEPDEEWWEYTKYP